jgi:transketolase
MKDAFIRTITEIMDTHENAIVVTADMGFSVFEELQKKYSKRFFNTGVTEQASVSVAAGLALSGYKVFFYAQASFATMRCFEQLHLDMAYNALNIKVIGVNAGVSLNQLGVSHFSVEDIGIVRTLPGVAIFSPGNAYEMEWSMKESFKINGPTYLRFTKLDDIHVGKKYPAISFGKPVGIVNGDDAAILVTGGIMNMAKEAAKLLQKKNIHVSLYSIPTIKPLYVKNLLAITKNTKHVFTLEEHSIIGGLGSSIAEIFAEISYAPTVYRLGILDKFISVTGSIEYLLGINGLTPGKIAAQITKKIKKE